MFMQDYNGENTKTLSREVSTLGLPGFTGIKKSSRIEGKPPQLIIKCDELTSQQELDLIAVINAHPANEAARIEDKNKLITRKKALATEWPDAFDLLDEMMDENPDAFPLTKAKRDTIKINNPKPEEV